MKFVVSRFLFRPYSPRSNNAIYPAPLMCQCGRAMDRKMWRLKRFWDTFLGRGKDRSFYLPVVFHIRCYERGELRFDFDHLIRLWQHHVNGRTDGRTDRQWQHLFSWIETTETSEVIELYAVWLLLYGTSKWKSWEISMIKTFCRLDSAQE